MIVDVMAGDMIRSHACKHENECLPVRVIRVDADTLLVSFEGRPTEISRYLTFTCKRANFRTPAAVSLVGNGRAVSHGLLLTRTTGE